jgi:hypothetical protein
MPALVVKDDAGKVTFTLYESFAITTYLASKLSSPTHEGIGNTGIGGRTARCSGLEHDFALEDAIGSHACSQEARACI